MSDHLTMIDDIERAVEEDRIRLSAWEDEFIQDMKAWEGELTERQDEVLEGIWRRASR